MGGARSERHQGGGRDFLAATGQTLEAVRAKAFVASIDVIERIDRMVMAAKARRNAALRELERHRAALAEALRRATDDVVDADFEDVAAGSKSIATGNETVAEKNETVAEENEAVVREDTGVSQDDADSVRRRGQG